MLNSKDRQLCKDNNMQLAAYILLEEDTLVNVLMVSKTVSKTFRG